MSTNLCNDGSSQSPINIDSDKLKGCSSTCDIQFFYRNSKCKLLIQEVKSIKSSKTNKYVTLDYDSGSYVTMNHDVYNLDTISFEIPSLHKVNNHSYPIEMNLHHRSATTGKILILAIFVDISSSVSVSSEFFNLFKDSIPSSGQRSINTPEEWNIFNCIPKIKNFYMYSGSIPRTPCSEDVTWIIMEHHVLCDEKFYNNLRKMMGSNEIRSIQPLNNRVVYYNSSVDESRNYGNRMKCYTDLEFRERCAKLSSNVEIETFDIKKNFLIALGIICFVAFGLLLLYLKENGYFEKLSNASSLAGSLFNFKILSKKKIINQ